MYWSSPKRRSKQQLAFEDARGDVGMADGAEQDGVELPQLVEAVGGEGLAGFEIAIAAPVEFGELQLVGKAFDFGDGLENFDAFSRHLRSRAVATNNRNFHRIHRL